MRIGYIIIFRGLFCKTRRQEYLKEQQQQQKLKNVKLLS